MRYKTITEYIYLQDRTTILHNVYYIPEFSELIDICIPYMNTIKLLYSYNIESNQKKSINLMIVDSTIEDFEVPEFYKYVKSCLVTEPQLSMSSISNNLNMHVVNNSNYFHIFVYEIPTIAELRDKKIEEII